MLSHDGIFYVVAAGLANHAGKGGYKGIVGNYNALGIEAENNGIGEVWPEVQMDAYAKGCAGIAKYCNLPVDMIIGHKEWSPKRKIDPSFDMDTFRKRIAKL